MNKQIIFNLSAVLIIFLALSFVLQYKNINISLDSSKQDIVFVDTNKNNSIEPITFEDSNSDISNEIINNTDNENVDSIESIKKENNTNVLSVEKKPLSNNEKLLVEAFAIKFNKSIESIQLNIEINENPYFKGVVDFDNSGMAANFYAYKNNNSFTIVGVENGVISCDLISNYNFSSNIIPSCYSPSSGAVVNR